VTTVADPDRLKAMLLAERAESERLRQIIKELQRYRFGRWAETLPEEQLWAWKSERPIAHLAGFRGVLQVDGANRRIAARA
jgi:hypothetical protein